MLEEDAGDYGDDRYFASSPIVRSPLKVVLDAEKDDLYASIGGSRRTSRGSSSSRSRSPRVSLCLLRRASLAGAEWSDGASTSATPSRSTTTSFRDWRWASPAPGGRGRGQRPPGVGDPPGGATPRVGPSRGSRSAGGAASARGRSGNDAPGAPRGRPQDLSDRISVVVCDDVPELRKLARLRLSRTKAWWWLPRPPTAARPSA